MTDPVVRVTNHGSIPVCIAHDPNWDDQVLFINGRAAQQTRCLTTGTNAHLGIRLDGDQAPEENLMGVIFADAKDFDGGKAGFYQSTIGHDRETGLLSVTDEFKFGTPSLKYSITDQTNASLDLTFVDE
ncbi:hypothetical protein C0Z18_14695 [Trinickia dabaoshanensis]|uniref:Uncharacterized protein n=1 Tax=Trinickia dabaoshanensis TaxID=564714 RepID=A0A2N7VPL5_9BURK|nr:hypothetical protein [Trinickia dabaoshanensis]PMS19072.1 hypothetical protein C0Z18_14695 [Trinickia dabaoshanensis]